MTTAKISPHNSSSAKPHAAPHVFFTVFVGGEKFGLPIECVRTVFRTKAITPVPLAPARMLGLINLRGHVVSAICMRRSLELPDLAPQIERLMVAIEHRGEGFALAIDNVGDVAEFGDDARLPLPTSLSAGRRNVTAAIFRGADAIVSLLNIDVLLGSETNMQAA